MSGRLRNQCINHFKKKLIEFEYQVLPPPQVPPHIVKPQYAINKLNPQFALNQGNPWIYNSSQIKKLKKSAAIASKTLQATQKFLIQKGNQNIKNGTDGTLTAEDIDKFVFNYIVQQRAYPTPIGFYFFPKSVCISINECVIHGIPTTRPIFLGDKINIDVCIYFDGFHGDTNLTIIYGGLQKAPTPEVRNILHLCQKGLYAAIEVCKPGVKFKEIGKKLQKYAKDNKIYIFQDFTGHGIGRFLHMPPLIVHTSKQYQQRIMKSGNVFTIEPLMSLYQSSSNLYQWSDNMTTISQNNPNAQFEHTILITDEGCQVITQRQGQNIPNLNGNIENLKIY